MTGQRKLSLFVLGALLPLIAYAAGMPSRPKFLDITLYGASNQKMVINAATANGPYITFQRSGVSKSDIGNGVQCGNTFTADSLCMAARAGGVVELAANGSSAPNVRIETAGHLHTLAPASEQLRLGGVAGASNPFLSLYAANGTTRYGYLQALSANSELQLTNETSAAPINFVTTGGGAVQANGLNVCTVAGFDCQQLAAVKTASTTRSSTVTITADPHLSVTVPSAGWYQIELMVYFQCTTTGTQGIKFQFGGTATHSATGDRGQVYQMLNGAASVEASGRSTLSFYHIATVVTSGADYLHYVGAAQFTGAGTFLLNWAQEVSNANATSMLDGSYLILRRIG